MADLRIRTVTTADIDDLVRIHNQAWQETYGGTIPQDHLDMGANIDDRLAFWQDAITEADATKRARIRMGFIDGEPAGFVFARPTPDEESPRDVELRVLYTLKIAHGTGLGRMLADAVLEQDAAWLWMLEGNDRAEAFYKKLGFRRDGEPIFRSWPDGHRDLRLVRDAQPALESDTASEAQPTASAVAEAEATVKAAEAELATATDTRELHCCS